MKSNQFMARQHATIALGGLFVFFDQFFKYLSRMNSGFHWYIWEPYLGWEYFKNIGIAFSLPISRWIPLFLTPFIGVILIRAIKKTKNKNTAAGLYCIFFGALSNYIDRIFFGGTIDYIRIFTSVINLADLLIVFGIVILFTKKIT